MDQAKVSKALETIERNVDLQTVLIKDILDISSIIRGKLHLMLRELRLAPLVEAAVAAIRPTAEAKRVELKYEMDAPLDIVSGDADRLQQVFWNLLSNAIKFTPRGGSVTVRLTQHDQGLAVMVRDTGQGISPSFLPYVFERFRQAESSITRVQGGLGLGLAIVRHLVEMHGGQVKAESGGVNEGATFWVFLPLKEKGEGRFLTLSDAGKANIVISRKIATHFTTSQGSISGRSPNFVPERGLSRFIGTEVGLISDSSNAISTRWWGVSPRLRMPPTQVSNPASLTA